MNPRLMLRIASVCLVFIGLAHATSFFNMNKRGAIEAAVFEAMQTFKFVIMGAERSHWSFYMGTSILMSVFLLTLGILTWLLSNMASRLGREILPMVTVLFVASLPFAVLCWTHFFAAPAVFATLATVALGVATFKIKRAR